MILLYDLRSLLLGVVLLKYFSGRFVNPIWPKNKYFVLFNVEEDTSSKNQLLNTVLVLQW